MTTTTTVTAGDGASGCYLHAAQDLQLESRALPPPTADEVQIAPRCTTLCGSDVHYYKHFRNGAIQVREPLCLGHEAAGEILALGPHVHKTNPELAVGDAVALECGVPCEQCALCKNGRYNVCPNLRFRSSASKFPHYQGSLQERVNHPAKWVHKLPKEISFEVGALLEPLAVAVHAVRRSGAVLEGARDSCLIIGAGAIGLLCSLAVQVEGCKHIVMVDIDNDRLQFALDNGFAHATYQADTRSGATIDEKKLIARESAMNIGQVKWQDGETVGQVQRTFECSGVESCLQTSIYATQSGGSVILVGMGTPDHTLPISDVSAREINLIPTWRYAGAYPKAIEIAKASATGSTLNGTLLPNVEKLITHRFDGLDSIQEAFNHATRPKDASGALIIKVAIGTGGLGK